MSVTTAFCSCESGMFLTTGRRLGAAAFVLLGVRPLGVVAGDLRMMDGSIAFISASVNGDSSVVIDCASFGFIWRLLSACRGAASA